MQPIYLASASPRRRELLTLLQIPFERLNTEVEERQLQGEKPLDYVCRLAKSKALAGVLVAEKDYPVLGADTIVVLDDRVLEKPKDTEDAARMLHMLSDCQHLVITAIAFANQQDVMCYSVSTEVIFRQLSEQDIIAYIASGEPMDKAGAYGIQGFGGTFVREIHGSYHAVVGLPLVETRELLDAFLAAQAGRIK
ncbi:septum formation inhibitor Maf [Budviciaceae bacterium CWB-B4]|uniref:dTTP/UTP pyrophosphatase n=1 Tax=Limnobaculum xujianqingii TaxID=2738837 RepID=A0A9D7AEZ3_9GAMM|nr:Maf family protein [Limnobaculum xujianqingii]MBK5071464.1 septum formation inhibitor Maf [Limnobaculum xujianqingii]MBK5174773.1 septum formation inhibitor Maf [Limnobaculum xujianqingii]